ncbi:uncharacterized protein LAESUDRAFT_377225 [Laetiporus sulphureus 93-53]|uniref:Uncharacterized protein n=1 Tax=Laetiporus sulphureus 93-53 TaxID=1314785 RepID=A0A165CPM7_9APHY|nr:uncharacterized protein LAESUDRAFT_377225 [Laetiporus sulphureus 93-53]KZT03190.1 hypothetical protein LAESUDRAFT_377225 [Laetiporus sulphureus 93-53]
MCFFRTFVVGGRCAGEGGSAGGGGRSGGDVRSMGVTASSVSQALFHCTACQPGLTISAYSPYPLPLMTLPLSASAPYFELHARASSGVAPVLPLAASSCGPLLTLSSLCSAPCSAHHFILPFAIVLFRRFSLSEPQLLHGCNAAASGSSPPSLPQPQSIQLTTFLSPAPTPQRNTHIPF